MDDIQNFILQIRYYYNQPNFMEEAGPILSSEEEEEPEFTNEFTPIESTLSPIPEEEDKMPVPFVEEVIKKSEPVLLQEQSPVDEFIPTKRSRYLIDGFTFYNELEMLYYRMTVLNDVVDYFVITEATKTHAGKDKPLYYNENKDRYKEFHHKIIHVVVDDLIVPDIKENEQWKNENHQRNAIDRGISQLALRKDDLILITDVDEIPNPEEMSKLKQRDSFEFKVASLHQQFFYYNLNAIMSEIWLQPKVATYEGYVICECKPQYIRMNKPYVIIEKGGWHLSYFGDAKFIKNKLENFAHQEFNKEEYTDEEKLRERIENFQDILIRPRFQITKLSVKENSNLPPRYEEFLSNFVLF
jgi:beta-1,4-mannosyl-glycoprotein beta-1,4-N-acetylglucosaminyltransferase